MDLDWIDDLRALSQDQRGEPSACVIAELLRDQDMSLPRDLIRDCQASVRTLTVDFLGFSNVSERALMKRHKPLTYITYRWSE